jgi:hypothetical protein
MTIPPFPVDEPAVSDEEWEARAESVWAHEFFPDDQFGFAEAAEAAHASGATRVVASVERWLTDQRHRENLVERWVESVALAAKLQAAQAEILAEAQDLARDGASTRHDDLSIRSLAAELAVAVRMSDRTLEQHMNDAAMLRDRFAATLDEMRGGRMSRPHAQVIVDEGQRLADDEVRAEYERLVLERRAHLTTGRLRAMAKSIAEQLDPVPMAERHRVAREERRIAMRDLDDSMSELWALIPTPLAHGIHDRITQMGRSIRNATAAPADADPDAGAEAAAGAAAADERTLDQLRADVLCDLLLTGHATTAGVDRDGGEGIDAFRAIVQITVPVQTLLGDDSAVPTLAGTPIDADSARRLVAGAALWHRILTDPCTGEVRAVDRRFPLEAQRVFLRARDEHCRFPGCRQPVWRCDADHTIDHQYGGPTATCNLAHLCRRHHTLKGSTAWRVEQRDAGILVWTSPAGRAYTDTPAPMLRFIPAGASPPT